MGKIKYSIVQRTVNLAEQALAKQNGTEDSFVPQVKFYGAAQQTDCLTLDQFAKHISEHHSKYGKGDIYCVLVEMVSCMREQLLLGNKISLGDMGSFYITLSSKGAEYYDEFSAQNITHVNVRWEQGQQFKDLLTDANFELVETRKAAAATMKQVRESYPSRPEEENSEGNGNGGSSSDSGGTTPGGSDTGDNTGGGTTPGGNGDDDMGA